MLGHASNQLATNLYPLFFQSLPPKLLHQIKLQPGSPATLKMEMHPRPILELSSSAHVFDIGGFKNTEGSLYLNFVHNRKEALCS